MLISCLERRLIGCKDQGFLFFGSFPNFLPFSWKGSKCDDFSGHFWAMSGFKHHLLLPAIKWHQAYTPWDKDHCEGEFLQLRRGSVTFFSKPDWGVGWSEEQPGGRLANVRVLSGSKGIKNELKENKTPEDVTCTADWGRGGRGREPGVAGVTALTDFSTTGNLES